MPVTLRSALFGVTGALLAQPALALDPGDPEPFVGEWAIAFPEAEGVIVNRPDATCEAPATIALDPDGLIVVTTPGGGAGTWAVKDFGERNPWWLDDDVAVTMVAEWIDGDRFLLAGKDASGINTDWQRAKQWTRCPS